MEMIKRDSDLNETSKMSIKEIAMMIAVALFAAGLLYQLVRTVLKSAVSSSAEAIKESALSASDIASMLDV